VRALALASPVSADCRQELREAGLPVWIHHGTAEPDNVKACAQGLAAALRKHTTVLSTVVLDGRHNGTTWTPLFRDQIPGCYGFWRWLAYAVEH
jgi:hypothetical protein